MINNTPTRKGQSGFALVLVLMGLALITTLFAITSSRLVAKRTEIATDRVLLSRTAQAADLLRLAASWIALPDQPVHDDLSVRLVDEQITLTAIDVGGLVDLNTANHNLLKRVARVFEVSEAGLDAYWHWRQAPNRLNRVEDFLRLTGATSANRAAFRSFTTLQSGRNGITWEAAPPELVAILGDTPRPDWESARSGVNYMIVAFRGSNKHVLGIVHAPPSGEARILRLH